MISPLALLLVLLPASHSSGGLLPVVQADTLTLEWAYAAALSNHPLRDEPGAQRRSGELLATAIRSGALPAISVSAQAVYHSDVANLGLNLPGVDLPSVPHDQYRAGLGFESLVYGRKAIEKRGDIAHADSRIAEIEAQVSIWSSRQRVEHVFFGILKAEALKEALLSHMEVLEARTRQLEVAVAGGVATAASVNVLQAEILRLEQEQLGAEVARASSLDVLGILTGRRLAATEIIALPRAPAAVPARPESALFDATRKRLDRQDELTTEKLKPSVQAFGDVSVGQPPGLNLFGQEFEPFFSVGLRLKWPVWDWRASAQERQAISIQREMVDARQAAFVDAVDAESVGLVREVAKYPGMRDRDERIISLRTAVESDAASRLENGVATATDYLVEANAVFQARFDKRMHEIQFAEARARLATITGDKQ
ncbi:MAG: outer membrane protein TolC [Rhodothermales bacterium]|jgi:outer membrane protein TolC